MHDFFKTLRGRFFLITLILTAVLGTASTLFGYYIFSRNLRQNLIQTAETNLQFLRAEINEDLSNLLEFSRWSRGNTELVAYVSADPSDENYSMLTKQATDRLAEEYLGNPASSYLSRVIIANKDGSTYLQRMSDSSYSIDLDLVRIIRALPYYDMLINAPGTRFDVGIQNDPFMRRSERMLPVLRPIESPYSSETVGFSYLQISFSLFTEPLCAYSRQAGVPVYLRFGGETWLIRGNLIKRADPPERQTEAIAEDTVTVLDTEVARLEHGRLSGIYVTAPVSGAVSISIPIASGSEDSMPTYLPVLLSIILLITVLGALLFIVLTRSFTKPVELLKLQLGQVARGDFRQNPEIEWDNEFGEIGRDINSLAASIAQLMDQRIAAEQEKKDYEYKMLQSQINPHFLYNALNSIKWMALAQHADGIAEMSTSLAHLLKSISKGTATIVSVQDELRLLRDYFTIQKYRYGGAIKLDIQVDDDALLQNQILRFTLQPIVENAIFHGIEPKGQSGQILVHIYRQPGAKGTEAPSPDTEMDMRMPSAFLLSHAPTGAAPAVPDAHALPHGTPCLMIDITDNGIGMDEATIAAVLADDEKNRSGFFRQLGIGSTLKRIQYQFGKDYGIRISSVPGEYTCVSICLPLLKLEQIED